MKKIVTLLCLLIISIEVSAKEDSFEKFYTYQSLSIELASKVAHAALYDCRKKGYSVTVAVVDRGGNLQALLRDNFAGPHTPETAIRKAWTANSFRQSTGDLAEFLQKKRLPNQIQHIPGALLVGGGVKIESQGQLLGAIGVSGAPPGKSEGNSLDGACAKVGIEKIQEDLDFGE